MVNQVRVQYLGFSKEICRFKEVAALEGVVDVTAEEAEDLQWDLFTW